MIDIDPEKSMIAEIATRFDTPLVFFLKIRAESLITLAGLLKSSRPEEWFLVFFVLARARNESLTEFVRRARPPLNGWNRS
jgi:3'-phosphoadenosine 5'-phosphosulfate sulfotransferase (PAPS reductase)/FAD synthetase